MRFGIQFFLEATPQGTLNLNSKILQDKRQTMYNAQALHWFILENSVRWKTEQKGLQKTCKYTAKHGK